MNSSNCFIFVTSVLLSMLIFLFLIFDIYLIHVSNKSMIKFLASDCKWWWLEVRVGFWLANDIFWLFSDKCHCWSLSAHTHGLTLTTSDTPVNCDTSYVSVTCCFIHKRSYMPFLSDHMSPPDLSWPSHLSYVSHFYHSPCLVASAIRLSCTQSPCSKCSLFKMSQV